MNTIKRVAKGVGGPDSVSCANFRKIHALHI